MRIPILLFTLLLLAACGSKKSLVILDESPPIYDTHVHIMSDDLVREWQAMGIPFSKAAAYYADIDTILNYLGANKVDLIGMGYVYGNPEFYQGSDAYQRLRQENDYLHAAAKQYPKRVRPFFAIDPLKDYAMKELRRCVDFDTKKGLKMHFSASGVYLTVPEHLAKVRPIFRYAAEQQLPILLHFDNWHPKFGPRDMNILVDSILQDIPAVELRIAHFGTSGGFNDKTRRFLDESVRLFEAQKIPERHQIWFDISAVALDKDSEGVTKLSTADFENLKTYIQKLGVDKVVFGTDYPLYRAREYYNILKEKVGLSEAEMNTILENSN